MPRWLDTAASDTQVTHRQRLWLYAIAALVLAFLIVPTLIVVPMSFSASQYLEFPPREWSLRWYRSYFASPSWMQATVTSFAAGALTTLVATPLGTLAAYGHGVGEKSPTSRNSSMSMCFFVNAARTTLSEDDITSTAAPCKYACTLPASKNKASPGWSCT